MTRDYNKDYGFGDESAAATTGISPHSGPWFHPHPLCEGCDKQFADWQAMADEVRVLRDDLRAVRAERDEAIEKAEALEPE